MHAIFSTIYFNVYFQYFISTIILEPQGHSFSIFVSIIVKKSNFFLHFQLFTISIILFDYSNIKMIPNKYLLEQTFLC